MINLTINKQVLDNNIKKSRENNIIIPTIKQMQYPENIPDKIRERLKNVALLDVDPANLFRITWKNEQRDKGGLYGTPNFIELPKKLTGVETRIICMVGKWFPTGCQKVISSFGCLAPRLVTGQFDITNHKAVWPSTGNYCRGGVFNSKLLGCDSMAILPEGMSRERFDWLSKITCEVIATPGGESDVRSIYNRITELRKVDKNIMVFNQFEEMGNYLWSYNVTGKAISDAFESIKSEKSRFAGACFTSGSAGTTASGDFLKQRYPYLKLAVGEALQCPTIMNNGFGSHRIEGIGNNHIPWIYNVKNTDMIIAVDDRSSLAILRLFNEPNGKKYLEEECGLTENQIDGLMYMGISGIANMLCAIKFAKYYELTGNDVVATVLTDSVEMYESRIREQREMHGEYRIIDAVKDYAHHIQGAGTDNLIELSYTDKKRVHNLKYYTWVEQQGKTAEELDALWYNEENTWISAQRQTDELDRLIDDFNDKTGLLS
jgi:cysteine synthase